MLVTIVLSMGIMNSVNTTDRDSNLIQIGIGSAVKAGTSESVGANDVWTTVFGIALGTDYGLIKAGVPAGWYVIIGGAIL
jgi:hypothetical protein